jgi:hypothetical protein
MRKGVSMRNELIVGLVCMAGGFFVGMQWPTWFGQKGVVFSVKGCALRTGMRKLWSDHVIWTRDYIIAAVAGADDAKEAADRLLKNQEDIGNAIVPYYGAEAGKKLTALLKDHILIAVDVVAAAKAGDTAKLKVADDRWHANARDIANFLSGANPKAWPADMMTTMLYEHLKLTTGEAVARIGKKWADDVKAFDAIYEQALGMADGLSNGIVSQFPEKF